MVRRFSAPDAIAPFILDNERENGLALREVRHRLANTLTCLAAALRCDCEALKDPDLRMLLRRHERRIVDFGKLHRILAMKATGKIISTEAYFGILCAALGNAILAPVGMHCVVFIVDGLLSDRKCQWTGLILAQLVTNSARHAFHDSEQGTVRIEIACDSKFWRCTVADNGEDIRGWTAGSGSQILDALTRVLEGTLDVRTGPNGTIVTVNFPC